MFFRFHFKEVILLSDPNTTLQDLVDESPEPEQVVAEATADSPDTDSAAADAMADALADIKAAG
jgi:hypothetical protein